MLAAAHIEGPRPDQPARQRFVPGHQAGEARQLAGQAVVVLLDEAAILRKRAPLRLPRFQHTHQTPSPRGSLGRANFLIHGSAPSSARVFAQYPMESKSSKVQKSWPIAGKGV